MVSVCVLTTLTPSPFSGAAASYRVGPVSVKRALINVLSCSHTETVSRAPPKAAVALRGGESHSAEHRLRDRWEESTGSVMAGRRSPAP